MLIGALGTAADPELDFEMVRARVVELPGEVGAAAITLALVADADTVALLEEALAVGAAATLLFVRGDGGGRAGDRILLDFGNVGDAVDLGDEAWLGWASLAVVFSELTGFLGEAEVVVAVAFCVST